jgi:hypothetical protein
VFDGFGGNIISGLINGIGAGIESVVTKAKEIGSAVIDNVREKFEKIGELAQGVVDGIHDRLHNGISYVSGKAEEIGSTVINKISEKFGEIHNVAQGVVDGLAQGIGNGVETVKNAAEDIARKALNAAKSFLEEKSPSRKFMEIGAYASEGMAVGLKSMAGAVGNSAEDVADTALKTLSKAMDGLGDVATADIDSNPTIRPVLDFSDIEKGMLKLDTLFAGRRTINLDLSGAISASNSSDIVSRSAKEKTDKSQTWQIVNNFDLTGLTVRSEADIDDIATKLYRKQQQAMRGKGVRGLAPA